MKLTRPFVPSLLWIAGACAIFGFAARIFAQRPTGGSGPAPMPTLSEQETTARVQSCSFQGLAQRGVGANPDEPCIPNPVEFRTATIRFDSVGVLRRPTSLSMLGKRCPSWEMSFRQRMSLSGN